MKAMMIKTVVGNHGKLRKQTEVDLPDSYVQFLVTRGMAVPLHGAKKEAAKTASERPSTAGNSPRGGQTGETKPSSSSPVVRAPRKQASKKSVGTQKS